MWSQSVTTSQPQKYRAPRLLPWVFTEHGALMAANLLRSKRAVQTSLHVVRAFVRLREMVTELAAVLFGLNFRPDVSEREGPAVVA